MEDEEMDEVVVKELKDMQQLIREMLPTNPDMLPTNPEIEEWMSQYRGFGRWIKEMKDLSEYIQELVDSGNAISKEDVDGIKQRFWLHNYSHEENRLYIKPRFQNHNWFFEENKLDEDEVMEELKAMQLHIEDKLVDAEDYHIRQGEIMQKWLDDIRYFSRKIALVIEYVDHLKKKHVPYRPNALEDSVREVRSDFHFYVIQQEAMTCWGVSWDVHKKFDRNEEKRVIRKMKDDIESMSMWIDFILTSTVSQGITQVKIQLLEELKTDLLQSIYVFIYYDKWADLKWRFYKIKQIWSPHPVTRQVYWNLFPFTKTEAVEMLNQLKAREEKWKKEMHGEGRSQDDVHVFFQQVLDLLDHYDRQSTDILRISRLQVDLNKFQQQFFQTSMWVDACIQATGEAKLSSSEFSSRSKEAYHIIKEDTEIMSWQLHVIMLAVQQEGWEKTERWLHELKEDLDLLLESSSSFRYFNLALLFSTIIGWGLLKWKLQTDKQIKSLLRLARSSSDCSRQEMDDIIKYLKDKKEWIKAALFDAGGEEIHRKIHQKWLSELRDLACQAEDLIGLYEYQQVANQVETTSSLEKLSIFCQQRTILSEIKEGLKDFMKKFDQLDKNKRSLEWRPRNADSSSSFNIFKHQDPGVLPRDADKFVGREEKMKELKEALLSVDGATKVIAVVGMGGVGKTTLCQHIYNDPEIGTSFSIKGFAHVGGNFDLLCVANDILTSLSKENGETYTQFAQLQGKINKCVRGKRLLLVLDDMWTDRITDWMNITTLFNDAGNGSKILISTRHEQVAKIAGVTKSIGLDKLSSEDGWSLLKMHAFCEDPLPDDLVEIGKDILAKCCGLPLAIKVVGHLLRTKGDNVGKWRSLLNDNWWNFSMHEADKQNQEILGPLYLSYWHLPPNLKASFRFISLFQKGDAIQIESLFELWVANDLISYDNGSDSMRKEAHRWIQDLASRSIVDIIYETNKFEGIVIKVHDLIHDIAQSISGNEFCFLGGLGKGSGMSLDGVRHLHVPPGGSWYLNVDNLLDTRSDLLRTIMVKNDLHNCCRLIGGARNMRLLNCSLSLLPKNLGFARNLRVLKIRSYIRDTDHVMLPTIYMLYNLREVHISCTTVVKVSFRIGNPINLRHLDLSYNHNMLKISESVSKLNALQYLNLGGCESLQELPSGIRNLEALQYLNLGGCESLQELPSGISNLKVLQYLNLPKCTSLQELPSGIGNLEALQYLNLRECSSLQELPSDISNLEGLQYLNLQKCSSLQDLPSGISNLKALRSLNLRGCKSLQELPSGISNLEALRDLNLYGCELLQELPSGISNLKALQYLNLGGCYSLKELPSGISNLKALRDLNLGGCYSLQELPCGISDLTNLQALDVSGTGIKYMPCWLSRLTKLKCLPCFPLGLQEKHASLKSLKAFQQLEGELQVDVNIVGCVKEEHAQEIEMSDNRQLSSLSISFRNYIQCRSSNQHEQILQKLKPNAKITELKIRGYNGVKLPSWMGSRSFDRLVKIKLSKLNRCTSLSPLHMLPSLEKLEIWKMDSLKDLLEVALEEENGGSSNTGSIEHPAKSEPKLYFPKLVCLKLWSCGIEYLRLCDCWFPALKSLFIYECDWLKDIHFSDPTSALEQSQNEGIPSLTELTIRYCPKLYFGRDAFLPRSLKKLEVWASHEVKRWCESNRASKLAHIPDIRLS